MHLIAGSVLAVGVLWLWLSGHWFGRVLAFLFGTGIAVMLSIVTAAPPVAIGSLLIGTPIAWGIASIPVWVSRGYVIRAG